MINMRTNSRYNSGLNRINLEPHRVEGAENWRDNLSFGDTVRRINKGGRFKGRQKRDSVQ